jgi:hypothetical protein
MLVRCLTGLLHHGLDRTKQSSQMRTSTSSSPQSIDDGADLEHGLGGESTTLRPQPVELIGGCRPGVGDRRGVSKCVEPAPSAAHA